MERLLRDESVEMPVRVEALGVLVRVNQNHALRIAESLKTRSDPLGASARRLIAHPNGWIATKNEE